MAMLKSTNGATRVRQFLQERCNFHRTSHPRTALMWPGCKNAAQYGLLRKLVVQIRIKSYILPTGICCNLDPSKGKGRKRTMNIGNAIIFLAFTAIAAPAAITVSPDEMAQKNQWVQQNLLTASNLPPFSFIYHGVPSSTLLPSWVRVAQDTILDTNRIQHVLTWTNAGINVQVKCIAVEYNDYPAVEWTVYLNNFGTINTPLIQNIQGLDTSFSRVASDPEFVLNGNKGDF